MVSEIAHHPQLQGGKRIIITQANSRLATQDTRHYSRNPWVHCQSQPMTLLSKINPIITLLLIYLISNLI